MIFNGKEKTVLDDSFGLLQIRVNRALYISPFTYSELGGADTDTGRGDGQVWVP
jgi:hypothetical protein